MAKLAYICAYYDWLDAMKRLDDAERGRLFTALLEYGLSGEEPDISGNEGFTFDALKRTIDVNNKNYAEKCEKMRGNGRKSKEATELRRKKTLTEEDNCQQLLTIANNCQQLPTIADNCWEDKDKYKDKYNDKDEYKDNDEYEYKDDLPSEDIGKAHEGVAEEREDEASMSGEGASEVCMSCGGASEVCMSGGEVSEVGMSGGEVSEVGMSGYEASEVCMSDGGASEVCLSGGEVSEVCMSGGGASEVGMSSDGGSEVRVSSGGALRNGLSGDDVYADEFSGEGDSVVGLSENGGRSVGVSEKGESVVGRSEIGRSVGGVSEIGRSVGGVSEMGRSVGSVSEKERSVGGVSEIGRSVGGVSEIGRSVAGRSEKGGSVVESVGKNARGGVMSGKGQETGSGKLSVEGVVSLYHGICRSFPKILNISERRRADIEACLRIYSAQSFEEMFRKAENSSFLKGENSHNWSATFDWFMDETNFTKILEGNFDNKAPRAAPEKAVKPRYTPNPTRDTVNDVEVSWAIMENEMERMLATPNEVVPVGTNDVACGK